MPPDMDADDYVTLVTGEMLEAVRPYAAWIDVFCERGAFDPDQSRVVVEAGATIALASNGNPGTSNTTSMAFCVATAVLQMGLIVEEAVWAATAGGALALRRYDGPSPIGAIKPGYRADLHAIDAPSVSHFAYRPGMDLTFAAWEAGARVR